MPCFSACRQPLLCTAHTVPGATLCWAGGQEAGQPGSLGILTKVCRPVGPTDPPGSHKAYSGSLRVPGPRPAWTHSCLELSHRQGDEGEMKVRPPAPSTQLPPAGKGTAQQPQTDCSPHTMMLLTSESSSSETLPPNHPTQRSCQTLSVSFLHTFCYTTWYFPDRFFNVISLTKARESRNLGCFNICYCPCA